MLARMIWHQATLTNPTRMFSLKKLAVNGAVRRVELLEKVESQHRKTSKPFFGLLVFCAILPTVTYRLVCAQESLKAKPSSALFTIITPSDPQQVLERLPPRVNSKPAVKSSFNNSGALPDTNLKSTLASALKLIEISRSTGDPRYLGRAQSTLGELWNSTRAPTEAIILQATIEQGRHEFDAAKKTLIRAIAQSNTARTGLQNTIPQAWLTLATLERISGNYPEAMKACQQVIDAGVVVYGQACALETDSHLGEHQKATAGLIQQVAKINKTDLNERAKHAFVLSLLAEAHERSGKPELAAVAYDQSLTLELDLYTAIAAADLALRRTTSIELNAKRALTLLAQLNDTDAVLIRRALAYKRLNNPAWKTLTNDLQLRFSQIASRGDDAKAHAREVALIELWLTENFTTSLSWALTNLERQRESIDWWVALQAATKENNTSAVQSILQRLKATQLSDARLAVSQK